MSAASNLKVKSTTRIFSIFSMVSMEMVALGSPAPQRLIASTDPTDERPHGTTTKRVAPSGQKRAWR